MHCPNCGHDNPPHTTFCFKCAGHLAPEQALGARPRIFVAPQEDLHNTSPQPSPKGIGFVELISWLLFIAASLWLANFLWTS